MNISYRYTDRRWLVAIGETAFNQLLWESEANILRPYLVVLRLVDDIRYFQSYFARWKSSLRSGLACKHPVIHSSIWSRGQILAFTAGWRGLTIIHQKNFVQETKITRNVWECAKNSTRSAENYDLGTFAQQNGNALRNKLRSLQRSVKPFKLSFFVGGGGKTPLGGVLPLCDDRLTPVAWLRRSSLSEAWGSRIYRDRSDLDHQILLEHADQCGLSTFENGRKWRIRRLQPAITKIGKCIHADELNSNTGYDVTDYFWLAVTEVQKRSKMPPQTASGRISRESFKQGSPNFRWLSEITDPTKLPHTTSLVASRRLQNAIKYCT